MMIVNAPLLAELEFLGFDVSSVFQIEGRRGYFLKSSPSKIAKLWESENPLFTDLNQEHIHDIGFCITIPTLSLYTETPT